MELLDACKIRPLTVWHIVGRCGILTYVIDRKWLYAALWCLFAAFFSLFGIIHMASAGAHWKCILLQWVLVAENMNIEYQNRVLERMGHSTRLSHSRNSTQHLLCSYRLPKPDTSCITLRKHTHIPARRSWHIEVLQSQTALTTAGITLCKHTIVPTP